MRTRTIDSSHRVKYKFFNVFPGEKITQNFKKVCLNLLAIKQRNFVFGGVRIIKCFNLFFLRIRAYAGLFNCTTQDSETDI